MFAVEAVTTANGKGDNHAVTNFVLGNLFAGSYDLAHCFMAENITFLHTGDIAVIEMQVRATDGGERYTDYNIVWVDNGGVGHLFNTHILCAKPTECFHCLVSSFRAFNGS